MRSAFGGPTYQPIFLAQNFVSSKIIYIYIQREFGYSVTCSTDDLCVTDYFSVFKVSIVNSACKNIFHMKI
jgi:hypothetical protein